MVKVNINGVIEDLTEAFTQIEDAVEPVEISINSQGGSAIEAIQLVNIVNKSGKDITARVEVQAMSAAAVIALGCPKVVMDSKAIIMLHNCWTVAIGNAKDLQNEVDACKAVDNALQEIVTAHCSEENAAYIRERMDDGELWLTGKQAAELFDNIELEEKPVNARLAAGGTLADLVDKYNALCLEIKALKDEPPDEEEQEEEKKDEAAEEPEEEKEPEEKQDYVVTDKIKAILDEVL